MRSLDFPASKRCVKIAGELQKEEGFRKAVNTFLVKIPSLEHNAIPFLTSCSPKVVEKFVKEVLENRHPMGEKSCEAWGKLVSQKGDIDNFLTISLRMLKRQPDAVSTSVAEVVGEVGKNHDITGSKDLLLAAFDLVKRKKGGGISLIASIVKSGNPSLLCPILETWLNFKSSLPIAEKAAYLQAAFTFLRNLQSVEKGWIEKSVANLNTPLLKEAKEGVNDENRIKALQIVVLLIKFFPKDEVLKTKILEVLKINFGKESSLKSVLHTFYQFPQEKGKTTELEFLQGYLPLDFLKQHVYPLMEKSLKKEPLRFTGIQALDLLLNGGYQMEDLKILYSPYFSQYTHILQRSNEELRIQWRVMRKILEQKPSFLYTKRELFTGNTFNEGELKENIFFRTLPYVLTGLLRGNHNELEIIEGLKMENDTEVENLLCGFYSVIQDLFLLNPSVVFGSGLHGLEGCKRNLVCHDFHFQVGEEHFALPIRNVWLVYVKALKRVEKSSQNFALLLALNSLPNLNTRSRKSVYKGCIPKPVFAYLNQILFHFLHTSVKEEPSFIPLKYGAMHAIQNFAWGKEDLEELVEHCSLVLEQTAEEISELTTGEGMLIYFSETVFISQYQGIEEKVGKTDKKKSKPMTNEERHKILEKEQGLYRWKIKKYLRQVLYVWDVFYQICRLPGNVELLEKYTPRLVPCISVFLGSPLTQFFVKIRIEKLFHLVLQNHHLFTDIFTKVSYNSLRIGEQKDVVDNEKLAEVLHGISREVALTPGGLALMLPVLIETLENPLSSLEATSKCLEVMSDQMSLSQSFAEKLPLPARLSILNGLHKCFTKKIQLNHITKITLESVAKCSGKSGEEVEVLKTMYISCGEKSRKCVIQGLRVLCGNEAKWMEVVFPLLLLGEEEEVETVVVVVPGLKEKPLSFQDVKELIRYAKGELPENAVAKGEIQRLAAQAIQKVLIEVVEEEREVEGELRSFINQLFTFIENEYLEVLLLQKPFLEEIHQLRHGFHNTHGTSLEVAEKKKQTFTNTSKLRSDEKKILKLEEENRVVYESSKEGLCLCLQNLLAVQKVTCKNTEPLLRFLLHRGLGDPHLLQEVGETQLRDGLIEAGLRMIEVNCDSENSKDSETSLTNLLALLDQFDIETMREGSQLGYTMFSGCLCKFLDPRDPRVVDILPKLLNQLQEEKTSSSVQLAIVKVLPPLIKQTHSLEKALVKEGIHITNSTEEIAMDLLNTALTDANETTRRGAAFGLGACVKGLTIQLLKQKNIMETISKVVDCEKGASTKQGAIMCVEGLTRSLGRLFEPYVIGTLPILLKAFSDSAPIVRAATDATATAIMGNLSAHGVKLVLPHLLRGIDDKLWRTRLASIDLLSSMIHCSPKQLGLSLPQIVPILAKVVNDTHSKVKEAGTRALDRTAAIVTSPEIKKLAPQLVASLTNSNEASTKKCLDALLSTSFIHNVDAASLSLVCPIVLRALKERSGDMKRKGAQIVGSMVLLIKEGKDIAPHLPLLLPALKVTLLDPIPDVRATSAKAFGTIARGLPEEMLGDLLPWLKTTLKSKESSVERSGAAHGISEILVALGNDRVVEFLQEIIAELKNNLT